MTLYEISEELKELENTLTEQEGEGSEELINAYFDSLEKRDEKVENYIALIKNFEAKAQAQNIEAKRLADRATSNLKSAKRLKDRLFFFMQLNKWSRIETTKFTASIANNGGKQPIFFEEAYQPEEVPQEFQSIKISFNTDAIRKVLEAGEELPFAQLVERGQHLRIR